MQVGIVKSVDSCLALVSVLADVLTNGFVVNMKDITKKARTNWRLDVGTVVVLHNSEAHPVPRALGSWVVEKIKCVPQLVCAHIPDITWTTDIIQRVIRSKEYAFGDKTYFNAQQLGRIRFRKGDSVLVGYVPSDDKLFTAIEYSYMPRLYAHALLRAMQAPDHEPQQWSPVTSVNNVWA